jgi:hypothetical protein
MTHTPGDNRSRRVASAAIWAVLLVGLLLFMVFGEVPDTTRFWEDVYHAGHVPLFGMVAVSILGLFQSYGASLDLSGPWWLAFTLAVSLGGITEILQLFQPGRDASFWHFLRDVAGAGSFLLVGATVRWKDRFAGPIRSAARRRVAWAAAALMVGLAGLNLAATIAAYGERDLAYPTLFAPDGPWWERQFVETHDSVLTPGARPAHLAIPSDEPLARLDLEPGRYPGIVFDEPYPDWRGARTLILTFVSDLDRPIRLTIRVDDAHHDNRYDDRFNRGLVVRPGFNRIAIPLDDIRRAPDRREMDMRHIRHVILFGYRLTDPTRVYLGPLRLGD